jgi:hypothetical protein
MRFAQQMMGPIEINYGNFIWKTPQSMNHFVNPPPWKNPKLGETYREKILNNSE